MQNKKISIILLLLSAMLCNSVNILAQADDSYLKEIRDELKIKWPNNRTVNIVFHGHSVPSGYYTGGNVHKINAYPHLSLVQITDKYPYAVVNSITTSVGGEQAETGETRFANEVLAMRPDVLFIDYALNDRNIGLERAKVAWQKMIDAALAHTFTDYRGNEHDVKVVLLTPTPDTREDILSESSPLALHAEQIRQLAKDNNVGLIDSYAIFKDIATRESLDPYMAQANHINAAGHQLVANEIAKLFTIEDSITSTLTEQVIADFESSIEVTPAFGASFEIVENPLKQGINETENSGQIKRTSANWWELIDIPCDFSIPANEVAYLHVMTKYPAQPDAIVRPNQMGNEINIRPIQKYTNIGEWQDIVFAIEGGSTGLNVTNIRYMTDCGFQNVPAGFVLDNESSFGHIDEIIVNSSPTPRTVNTLVTLVNMVEKKDYLLQAVNQSIHIRVLNNASNDVKIYNHSGMLLFSEINKEISFRVPKAGLYIIRIGNSIEKLLVL